MGILQDLRASRAPALAFVAMGVVWAATAAQVPVLKAQIGASDSAFGLSFLISSLGAISAMWLAPVVDRKFGARALMLASAAMGLSFLIPAVAGGLALFTFGMLLAAASSGVCDILMNARISEIEETTRRPLMNLNHAIFSFAYAGTAVLTGLAREAGLGPLAIYLIAATAVLAMCRHLWCPHGGLAGGSPGTAGTQARGIVLLAGILVLAGFFTEQSVEGWSALHLERTLGGGAAQGALGPAILGLTMGFGRLFGQALAARVRDTVMIGLACLVSAFGLSLAAMAPTLAVAYLGFGILGLGISVVVPLTMALVGRAVPHAQRVAAIGQASVIGYGAFLIGPSLIGLTSDQFGLRTAFLLVAAVLVLVSLLVVPLIARRIALAD